MSGTKEYRKSLGQAELVSLGIGGTIGSGIFVVPGIAAGIMGSSSLIAWLIVAVTTICVLFSLLWLTTMFGSEGNFYAIFRGVYGKRISTILVILYIISSIFGVATIAAGIGQYISYFEVGPILIIEAGIILFFCILNLSGVYASGKTEVLLTVLKIVPLAGITLILLPFIHTDNLLPLPVFSFAGLFSTVVIVFWPFTGFEITAIPVDEMRDTRVVARSLMIVIAVVTVIYISLNIALIGSMGSTALAASPAPLAAAVSAVIGEAGWLIAVIGIITMLSALNAYIVGASRVTHTIAGIYRVPAVMSLSKRGVPASAIVVICAIGATLIAFSNKFATLAVISVITTLIPYIFFCLAAFILSGSSLQKIVSSTGAGMSAGIIVLYFLYG